MSTARDQLRLLAHKPWHWRTNTRLITIILFPLSFHAVSVLKYGIPKEGNISTFFRLVTVPMQEGINCRFCCKSGTLSSQDCASSCRSGKHSYIKLSCLLQ